MIPAKVFFPADGTALSLAHLTASSHVSATAPTSERPLSPSSTEGVSYDKLCSRECVAGMTRPGVALKSPDVSNSMELIDVLDAFDAFHGSEWLNLAAVPAIGKDEEEKVDVAAHVGPVNEAARLSEIHATSETTSTRSGAVTEVGTTGETAASRSRAGSTVDITCGTTGETGEAPHCAQSSLELREDTGGTGSNGTSDDGSTGGPAVVPQLTDKTSSKRSKEHLPPTREAEQAKPARALSAHDQNADEVAIGQQVRLKGLKRKPEFNGKVGRIEALDQASGRYSVRVQSALGPDMRAKLKREHFDVEPPTQLLAENGLTTDKVTLCQASRQRGDFPRPCNASRRKQSTKVESDLNTNKTAHGGGLSESEPVAGGNVHPKPNVPATASEETTITKPAISIVSMPSAPLAEAKSTTSKVAVPVDPSRRAAAEARVVSVGRAPATVKGGVWRPTLRS
jgi:hypothetical protein